MLTKCFRTIHATRRFYCSSLISVFNHDPPAPNGNFITRNTNNAGLFNIPELTSSKGFAVLKEQAEQDAARLLNEALAPKRSRKLVAIFDELSDSLCRVADMAECMRVLHPDTQYRQSAEEASAAIVRLVEELNTNASLYAALKSVVNAGGELDFNTDSVDHRVAQLLLADFELCGIHLDAEKRQKFVAANDQAFNIGAHFMQGTASPRKLKKSLIAKGLHGDFSGFIDSSDNDVFMVSSSLCSSNSHLSREVGYRVFYFPDPNQEELLRALLETRHNLAELTGFEKYSDRATRHTMAGSADAVMNFLNSIHDNLDISPELTVLRWLRKELIPGAGEEMNMWDMPFLIRQARQRMLGMSPDVLSEYFPLGQCMEALNSLCRDLFGVTFHVETPNPGELWHPKVFRLEVKHEDEGLLGLIYLDLFMRAGKPSHDCHYTIRGGRQLDESGTYQQPIVTLHLNLTPPFSNKPPLLTLSEVENLFHEFGHALHSMLGRTRYQHVTGTRTSTDFAEVPSTLMERFAMDQRMLEKYSRHYRTNEALPVDSIAKLHSSRNLLMGIEIRQHVMYAALDQILHGSQPLPGSPTEVMRIIHNGYFPIPYVEKTAWHHRFSHLVGYGAKYYSYLMARALANRLWDNCFDRDPFSREQGKHYRKEMLAFGGERPPSELFQNLTGQKLTPESMAAGLVHTVNGQGERVTRKFLTGL